MRRLAICIPAAATLLVLTSATAPGAVGGVPEISITSLSWSADGRWLAYDAINYPDQTRSGVFLVRSDGRRSAGPVVQGIDAVMQWSPRRAQLAVSIAWTTWLVTPGGSTRQLEGRFGDWSQSGSEVLLVREGVGSAPSTLWVVSVKTGAARYLADGATPRWSPDGRRIAFSVAVRSNAFYCVEKHLFSITPDGSDRRRLAADPQPFMAQTPTSWSPDGARIAFTEAPGGIECNGPSRAMLAARDGSKPTHVIGEGVARWLTGGRRLVLQYSSYYGVPTVGIVRPSGRVVARFVNAYDFTPSPDGRRIVLSFAGRLTVARTDAKGGRHRLAGGDIPRWSSQNWIAFSAARGCARTVDRAFVVRPSGKHLHALTRCPPSS